MSKIINEQDEKNLLLKLAKLMNVNSLHSIRQVITGICKIKYNDASRETFLKEVTDLTNISE